MKKVLSFVLVLSLVLGSFSMAFAAAPTDVVGKSCETAVQALSDLGVVSGYTDGTYKPENPVNRAEAAKLVISALGLEAYAAGITSTSFTDLDGFGWAVGYIGYANQLGLVKGVGNNKFNPAGPVTYEQWATMLVRALGYTDEVLPGTWPANYMIKAQSLGIMKDIKAAGNAAANRGDVAIMLYNNLGQAIGTINKDGEFIENIGRDGVKGTDTMLSRLEKEATPDFGVFTDTALANVADGINLRAYLGANVKLYLNDDDEFIGIKDCNSTFLTGDFDAAKGEFESGDVTYTIKKDALNKDIFGFVNGEFDQTVSLAGIGADMDDITLAVKYSGKTITDAFSVLTWRLVGDSTADQFEAGDLNTSKNTLFGKNFVEDNNGNIDTTSFELLGVSSLDKIAEDNIVEVYVDSNKDIRRVAVGTTTVEGAVSKINSDGDKFTINGTAYKLDADVRAKVGGDDLPGVTDEGKAFLTYGGKIGMWEETDATAGNYAVVTDYDKSATASGKTTVTVTLFTKEGKEVEYTLKDTDVLVETVNAAGDVQTTDYAFATPATFGFAKDQLVKYSLNSDGKIKKLVAFDNSNNVTGKTSKTGTRIGTTPVKDSVVVFLKDGDDWTLGSMKELDDDVAVESAKVFASYSTLDSGKVAAIALDKDQAAGTDDTYGIIGVVSKRADEKNDSYWAVEGYNDGAALDALTDNEDMSDADYAVETTTASGIAKIVVNTSGKVTNIVYDPGAANGADDYLEGLTVSSVTSSKNEVKLSDGKTYGLDEKAVVYVYDEDEDLNFKKGTIKDLEKGMNVKLYLTDEDDFDGFNIVMAWD